MSWATHTVDQVNTQSVRISLKLGPSQKKLLWGKSPLLGPQLSRYKRAIAHRSRRGSLI
jgi:hypothetical protein